MRQPSKIAVFEAAKVWNAAALEDLLSTAQELARATDSKGRTALHVSCVVKPGGGRTLGEPNGIKAVSVFLDAGAGLEDAVPMDEAEEDSRANTALVRCGAGREPTVGSIPSGAWGRPQLFGPGCGVTR